MPATQVLGSTNLANTGAFAEATNYTLPRENDAVTVVASYTRGTAGGLPIFKLKWTIGGAQYWDTTPSWVLTVNGATVESPIGVSAIPGPAPADSSALPFSMVLKVAPGATHLQVYVAEADATKATPGTIASIACAGR